MTLKPPTRTLPKVKVKEWPHIYTDKGVTYVNGVSEKSLSDFTRVVEETGGVGSERDSTQKASIGS